MRATAKQVEAAKLKADEAVGTLLSRAHHYSGASSAYDTRNLLSAAREYGRALERVSRVRRQR